MSEFSSLNGYGVKDVIARRGVTKTSENPLLNSYNGGLRFNEIGGASEQATTTGKNLLDCSGLSTATTNGITFTPTYNANGKLEYVNANGTASAETYYNFAINKRFLAGSYIYSSNAPSSANTYFSYVSGTSGAVTRDYLGGEFALSEDSTLTVSMKIPSGQALSNVKFYPMIRLASNTDATYEPYTNGASPNPDYPQEIESAFDCVEMRQGYYTASGCVYSAGSICNVNPVPCKSGDVVKLDLEVNQNIRIYYYLNGTYVSNVSGNDVNTLSATVPSGIDSFNFYISKDNNTTVDTIGKISLTINGKSVVQIKTGGKNLYNLNSTASADSSAVIDVNDYITLTANNSESTSTAYVNYFTKVNSLLKEGTTYAIVVEVAELSGNGVLLALASTDNTKAPDQFAVWTEVRTTGTHILLRKTKNSFANSVFGMRSYFQVPAGVSGSIKFRISIIEDTSVTSDTFVYEPYTETSATITLSEPLRAVGEVKDQIVKRNGVWGVLRNFAEVTFNGSESWITSPTNTTDKHRNVITISDIKQSASNSAIDNLISNCYTSITANESFTCVEGITVSYTSPNLVIFDSTYNTSDISLWKTYLASNPLTVVYELATPTFEELPTADQIALNSLETFDGVTNIVFDSTVEPTFEVEYGMSSASAYSLKALNDSEINALGGKATNSKELTNGELYSDIIRGYKYGRTVVLSFLNVTPLALTTYLMNNSAYLDNAHDIYANLRLLIIGTYAGVGVLTCSAYNISNCANDEMYSIQYYLSANATNFVNSDDETAYISGTITYVATNFDIE